MHQMMLFVFVGLAAIVCRPRRKQVLQRGQKAISKLRRGRLTAALPYVDTSTPGVSFWQDTGGFRGLLMRLYELKHVVTGLQMCVALEVVESSEARKIWRSAVLQIVYSLAAFPEALLCKMIPSTRRIAGLRALQHHWQVVCDARLLCQVQGAPPFILDRGAFL